MSVNDLCSDAGVLKGSFYYFFPSKRDLALAAIDAQWDAAHTTILKPAFAADVAPMARFRRFFGLAADRQGGERVRGCPFGNLAAEMATTDPLIRERVGLVFDQYLGYFRQALLDAADSDSLRAADVSGMAQPILACFQGALLLAKTRNDADVIVEVCELTLAGLFC
ncbi:MAG: TetR/AcrR family transcriptional regulator, partial [Chloroflexota bacterium]|nr:TetR/AcrR family transcriptional regulator [Chloroflexota bacterium]